jgi:exodeoxyribonuclease VII large subunit
VSQLVRGTTRVLDRTIGVIWVEGEISALTRPSSGHLYFCLGDGSAQLRAVMWRTDASRLRFALENGQRLTCRGRLGVYERDGKFQLYVQAAEPAGLGGDALAFEQLKRKLAQEGLFDAGRKRRLPHLPRRIGVVTSQSGAAVRDIIRAVQRRFPVPILIADTQVQGPGAPRQIVHALGEIARAGCDLVIVGRGGGSATDLSAFNDEQVVRAVAACPVPTISAVGHEIDLSLTDLVADQRAATPTMAGEMAVPVLADLAEGLVAAERRLLREMEVRMRGARQDLDHLAGQARAHMAVLTSSRRRSLAEAQRALEARHPQARLVAMRAELRDLLARSQSAMRRRLEMGARGYAEVAGRLHALSPLKVLQRGYAIAVSEERVLCDAAAVEVGASVKLKLARGALDCRVERVTLEHDD